MEPSSTMIMGSANSQYQLQFAAEACLSVNFTTILGLKNPKYTYKKDQDVSIPPFLILKTKESEGQDHSSKQDEICREVKPIMQGAVKRATWHGLPHADGKLDETENIRNAFISKNDQHRKEPANFALSTCVPLDCSLLNNRLWTNEDEEKPSAHAPAHGKYSFSDPAKFSFGGKSKIPNWRGSYSSLSPKRGSFQGGRHSVDRLKQRARIYLQLMNILKSCGIAEMHREAQQLMKKNIEIQAEIEEMRRDLRKVTLALLRKEQREAVSMQTSSLSREYEII